MPDWVVCLPMVMGQETGDGQGIWPNFNAELERGGFSLLLSSICETRPAPPPSEEGNVNGGALTWESALVKCHDGKGLAFLPPFYTIQAS